MPQPVRERIAFCGRSSYQACTTSGRKGMFINRVCRAVGCASILKASVIALVTVVRCLKFSMNCAVAVRLVLILWGTLDLDRSEERRAGKEGRSRWAPCRYKTNP